MISVKRGEFHAQKVSVLFKIGVFFSLKISERGHFPKWRTLMGYTFHTGVGVPRGAAESRRMGGEGGRVRLRCTLVIGGLYISIRRTETIEACTYTSDAHI